MNKEPFKGNFQEIAAQIMSRILINAGADIIQKLNTSPELSDLITLFNDQAPAYQGVQAFDGVFPGLGVTVGFVSTLVNHEESKKLDHRIRYLEDKKAEIPKR